MSILLLVSEVTALLNRGQCAIPLDSTVLLTGGYSGSLDYLDYVTEYSTKGLEREWPRLREAREGHGCGRVGQVSAFVQYVLLHAVLV